MSELHCIVCGRVLEPHEIRINERGISRRSTLKRYLCVKCRRADYDQYQKSIRELINKK